MHLGHLAYAVRDLEKTKAFYIGGLGFTEQFVMHNESGGVYILYIKVNEREFIEFFPTANEIPKGGSFRHLCLEVEDINAEQERLSKRGIKFDGEIKQGRDGNFQLWLIDPDGNKIELMQLMPNAPQLREI